MARHDGRAADQLRAIEVTRGFTGAAPGSIHIRAGQTTVLCTAMPGSTKKPLRTKV